MIDYFCSNRGGSSFIVDYCKLIDVYGFNMGVDSYIAASFNVFVS